MVNKHELTTTRVKGAKKGDQLSSSGKETSVSQTVVDTDFTISEISADSSEYEFHQIWQNGKKYPIISKDLCKTAVFLVREQWRHPTPVLRQKAITGPQLHDYPSASKATLNYHINLYTVKPVI